MLDLATHPLVQAAWLAEHLHDRDLRIVDMRWRGDGSGLARYKAGHLPGAVHLDWQRDLGWTDARGVRDLLLPPERFAAVMSHAGIGSHTRVVAYAETDYAGAARLWWALHYYGHRQVAILDGGWTKWVAESREMTTDEPPIAPLPFTSRPQSAWLAHADEITDALRAGTADFRLLDTRPIEQYIGSALWTPRGSWYFPSGQDRVTRDDGRVLRGGHIPGALHWHATTLLNHATWTHLPVEAIRARAEAVGLHTDQRIVTYCGVGITASLGLFALRRAGFAHVALYDASWEEWGGDPTLPVAR